MIDVAFTRAELRPADVAVVIDVLRATSTATQALASGYRRVLVADGLEQARALRRPGRVLAGERHCLMPDGFDQGNSPLDAIEPRGTELVLATTNGAPTIVLAAKHVPRVLLGCLLNLDAVIAAVLDHGNPSEAEIQLVCSGTDGAPAIEDVYAAGRLSSALPGRRSDTTLIAEAVARTYRTPADALNAGADARVLRASGMASDIAYCSLTSELSCVPVVVAARAGVAVVADRAATRLTVIADESCAFSANPGLDGGDTVSV